MTSATENTHQPAKRSLIATSTITCPQCGHRSVDVMPVDACQFLYDCKGCGAVLRPKPGDCCVYCSYGDVKCPPVQKGEGGCRSPDGAKACEPT